MKNLDVTEGSDNINPNARELASAIEESSGHNDTESNMPAREDFLQGNEFKDQNFGKNVPRHEGILESLETFTNEVNLRLSQEMDSMMSMVLAQINRAISSAISDRVIPERRKIVSSMSSSGIRDTEAGSSPKSQENRERIILEIQRRTPRLHVIYETQRTLILIVCS